VIDPGRHGGASVALAPGVVLYARGSAAPPLPDGTLVLSMIPSPAFGDSSHPTTRLCAQAVDLWCRTRAPGAVLDVGTGSGVLARIARARSVPFVVGTDTDRAALDAARANAALDPGPGELLLTDRPPDAWGPRFDLVVANILEGVLLELAETLVAALAPGGRLLLCGFTPLQTPALRAAYADGSLALELQTEREGWAMLQLAKAG
jgi:ribosomal protein L11 methyltransferase